MNSIDLMQLVNNPKIIESIFGEQNFCLSNVKFCKLEIDNLNKSMLIYIELNEYPNFPPLKWKKMNYNKSQLILRFIDVSHCNIINQFNQRISIAANKNKNEIIFKSFVGEKKILDINSKWIYIDNIIGYQIE
jgi:hypothetical protein